MPVKFVCPNPGCTASYTVADEALGRIGRCKKCGTKFPLVPGTVAPNLAPSADFDSFAETAGTGGHDLPSPFGRYKILRTLGKGGMGTVYLAHDTELDRQVALKVPHLAYAQNPEVRERFLREARAAARFHHPNFCPIHDIGQVDGIPYLTMAFIEGRTLAELIEPDKPWPQRRAVEVIRQLAIALAEAHRQGVVHRDLKPANIMVDGRGALVLMDFGLARRLGSDDATFTAQGAVLGTPAYMPPEQAEGQNKAVGPHSDIYSLGVILYELLTGKRPYEGSAVKVLAQILMTEPTPLSEYNHTIDNQLEAICLKAMSKKPRERHSSMEDFASSLNIWLQNDRSSPEQIPEESFLDAAGGRVFASSQEPKRVTSTRPKPQIPAQSPQIRAGSVERGAREEFHKRAKPPATAIDTNFKIVSLIGAGGIFALLFTVIFDNMLVQNKDSDYVVLIGIIGILGILIATFAIPGSIVLGAVSLFKAWKILQPLRSLDPSESRMPSPRIAIVFLFVPIFGTIWKFVAYYQFILKANKYIALKFGGRN